MNLRLSVRVAMALLFFALRSAILLFVVNSTSPSFPAIFLDRDGTLMIDVEYCGDPALVAVFPGAADALATATERVAIDS